ncbi:MAG: glutamate 5-kinase [Candidatus Verstraetearchaeota archaeon]|jgi:glutamate 5-kinase|nr:glutamate 5-kinase [Candidatus Verstraetearchaeota archaeon]
MIEEEYRKELSKSKLIVVKVGSTSLSDKEGFLDLKKIEKLCDEIANLKNKGIDVILVSSGAIRAGRALIKNKIKSSNMPSLQALAAIGQVLLMEAYRKIMEQRRHIVAQILLTWDDFKNKRRLRNLLNTLNTLLSFGAIPIINENDTVAVDEIKFGDNDTLSALVAKYMQADLLVILSDVDGLYSGDPNDKNSKLITFVSEITPEIEKYAQNKYEGFGGMITKIKAAKIVMEAGIPMVIANSSIDNVLERIISGEKIGTIFIPKVGI